MKKTAAFLLFITIITVITIILVKRPPPEDQENVLPSRTKRILQKEIILDGGKIIKTDFDNREYTILAVRINDSDSLSLIPNFSEKYYAEDVSSNMECGYAINAGFYKENYSPLGLFYANGVLLGKTAKSSLAKGYFIQYKDNKKVLTYDPPKDFALIDFAFQSGPLTQVRDIKIPMLRDEHARRSLIGWDGQNFALSKKIRFFQYSNPQITSSFLQKLPEEKQRLRSYLSYLK